MSTRTVDRTMGTTLAQGAVGGLVAGAAFLVANMWFATSVGNPAKGPILMMSTILKGDEAMMTGAASVGVGLLVHAGLSALFGVAFALLAARIRTNGGRAAAGTLFGAGLYVLNFKVLSPLFFTTFEMANQPFELAVHIVFGTLLGIALFSTPRRVGTEEAPTRAPATAGASRA